MQTKQAIENRRSIRKFKTDPVPQEYINELIESARLAPSGCNSQPWRFKVITDKETKQKLAEACFNQNFIAKAPAIIICAGDARAYLKDSLKNVKLFARVKMIDENVGKILIDKYEKMQNAKIQKILPQLFLNVGIAIEHLVLRALDFNLGTCWVRLFDEQKIKQMFDWDENIQVTALIPIGFPDEAPEQRKRLKTNKILL